MIQVKQNAENLLRQSGIQINSEGDLLPYDMSPQDNETIDDHSSIDTLDQVCKTSFISSFYNLFLSLE